MFTGFSAIKTWPKDSNQLPTDVKKTHSFLLFQRGQGGVEVAFIGARHVGFSKIHLEIKVFLLHCPQRAPVDEQLVGKVVWLKKFIVSFLLNVQAKGNQHRFYPGYVSSQQENHGIKQIWNPRVFLSIQ